MLPSRVIRVTPLANHGRVLLTVRLSSTAASTARKEDKKSASKPKSTSSFVMNLFRGRSVLSNVFPYPLNLDEDRKEMLSVMMPPIEKFLTEVNNPAKNDDEMNIPAEIIKQFADLGVMGALVPEEYEGAGLNNSQLARLAEIVGANDLAMGVVMGAHQSIGYKGILLYGSEEQKKKYLPDLATGRRYACFCLTEPGSGSDANSIRSRAVKSEDGKHYILNGGKIWISNGNFADIFTVFAKTPVKDENGVIKEKTSAFIVERGYGGVTHGALEKKMGIKGSNTVEVNFENTKIPVENLLGEEGEGFKVAMNILNNGRFGIPAACTGSMKWCIQKTLDFVTERVQFGKKLMEFGNVQEQLIDMVTKHYATESVTYMLAANMDKGVQDYQLEAAIGKVMASENAWLVCDAAIQLHGGNGFMKEYELERVLRDLRIYRIFEGANDILRLFIALTGMQFSGKHLQHTANQIKSGSISTLVSEAVRRISRSPGGDAETMVHPSLKDSASLLNKVVVEFGKTSEGLLMKHKKGIVDRQWELIRMANAAIDIYAMVCVLARYTRTAGAGLGSAHEERIANLFCTQASKRALGNIADIQNADEKEIKSISSISADICKQKGLVQRHPVDV